MEQCVREGLPFPDAIKNAPALQDGLGLYYTGFQDLVNDRPADGSIPWLSVHTYCVSIGLGEDQEEAMHYHIRGLDNVYLNSKKV